MNAHVFVDAENVPPDVTFRVVEYFGREHTITRVDIVAKEETLAHKYRNLDPNFFRVQNCYYGKNSADTWICIEIVRAIIDEPDLELVIILSSDRDFLPVIKFAADFEKKILIVSNGEGHKSLTAHMKTLGMDLNLVELKDFRCGFDNASQRLSKFLPLLYCESQRFFFKHSDELKFIWVRRDNGRITEIPFVNGMSVDTFRRVVRELKILGIKRNVYNFCANNFLKVENERVRFMTEDEIASHVVEVETVDTFLERNAAAVRKIFVKHAEKIFEIPFVDGMTLEMFGKLLREKKIIGKTVAVKRVAEKSLLDVRDKKVYLRDAADLENLCNTSEANVENFFLEHLDEIKKIFIKHGGEIFEIPFVNGMPLETFGKLLREKKIIGKTVTPKKIAEKNLLAVHDKKVYLRDAADLENFCNTLEDNVDDFFFEHLDEVKKIFVTHGEKIFEIPFVNGMPLETFGKLLRWQKIINLTVRPAKVAEKSLLAVRDGKVYLRNEDDLENFCDELNKDIEQYLTDHTDELRTIVIRHGKKFLSFPFVDGMPFGRFCEMLRRRNINTNLASYQSIAKRSLLDVRDDKIFLLSETELVTNVDDYLNEHALEIKSMTIRHGSKDFSIPFVNGMPLGIFGLLLHERKIISGFTSAITVAEKNSLVVRNERIFSQ